MTQKDKELLLKDLCARLPYRVIVHICSRGENAVRDIILSGDNITNAFEVPEGWWKEIKPYLRPMSSMTEEEEIEYDATFDTIKMSDGHYDSTMTYKSFDWLNAHHFDYRGLIPKGLALEATEDMYKEEQ